MARERVKLTDKEEKILVQAQLMGLTTASMVKIGNRLKALERESEQRSEVADITKNYNYTRKSDGKGWEITTDDGYVWHFTGRSVTRYGSWNSRSKIHYNLHIEKPGTRFHRSGEKVDLFISDDWGPAKLMPEKNKELYAMMRGISHNRFDKILKAK